MQPFKSFQTVQVVICIALLLSVFLGCALLPTPDLDPTAPPSAPGPTADATHEVHLPLVGEGGESPLSTPSPEKSPKSSPTPGDPPTATPLPPPVHKPGYGVQVHFFAGDMGTTIKWIDGLGVGWVKQQVEWHTIEQGPDDFAWVALDNVVNSCEAMGFKLLLSVVHAPDWTRPTTVESGPPSDYAAFGRFMAQLAARYKGRVAAYELWNEPNLAREWRGDTLDPERFVALIAEGSQGVRAADPDALVISGAPGVTGINDGVQAIDDRVFLRGMYQAGVDEWVDGIGVHPYGFANPPQESWQDADHASSSHNDHPSFFFRDTLQDYHAIMLEYGDTERQLWATEFGWPSVEHMGSMDTRGWEYGEEVSEQEQADYIVQAFHMGDERPWVGPMFLWNLNLAEIWGPANPVSAYSILRPDGSYRPAYIALRLMEPLAP